MSAALVIVLLAIWLAPLAVAVTVAPWLVAARLRRAVRS
jgi:hypothetical protein